VGEATNIPVAIPPYDKSPQSGAMPGGGSRGNITAVNAGTGLSGGGDSGDVTLSLDQSFTDGRYIQNTATPQLAPTSSSPAQGGQASWMLPRSKPAASP